MAGLPPGVDIGPPVVAICGGDGAIAAAVELLHHLREDTGFSFLVLLPEGQDLLRRATAMEVVEAQDGMVLQSNRVHLLPPGSRSRLSAGRLRLNRHNGGFGGGADELLESLAAAKGERAVAVLLSGAGVDGTEGLRRMKETGGIALAQSPETAARPELPEAAIATGTVDVFRSPASLADELERLSRHPFLNDGRHPLGGDQTEFTEILTRLDRKTGVDFASYKPNTLRRRIRRRMILNQVATLPDYVRLLDELPHEADELYADLLIQVTALFRDPELYEALATRVMPRLFESRPAGEPIRMWVPACSTGEEAYSLAILLHEERRRTGVDRPLQVFATDLSQAAIERARQGWFPASVAGGVPPDLLERYFRQAENGYVIAKEIRGLCVFARQDVTRDPPFSRVHMISCRNLLIYLTPAVQHRVLRLFHGALLPNGFLVLGRAETVGREGGLFGLFDRGNKIYVRESGAQPLLPPRRGEQRPSEEVVRIARETPRASGARWRPSELHREADRVLLARFGPPGVLVDEELEIVQVRGRIGRYLEPPPGAATQSLLKMARKGLLVHLRSAVQQCRSTEQPVRKNGLQVNTEAGTARLDLEVIPVRPGGTADRYFLVLFDESPYAEPRELEPEPEGSAADESEGAAAQIQQELAATREYLNSIIEEREAANEELTAASEEIQSANEELQSANEELETAKEELQATNEELTTVNEELHERNLELTRANNDLKNLLATFSIPVLILGPDLTIRRFTPMVERLMNVIPGDVGRSIGQIRANLEIPGFEDRVTEVIETLVPHELEAQDREGRWYSVRIRPYRTAENLIDGAIVVFVDIDAMKRALDDARIAGLVANGILESVEQPILILDRHLRINRANAAFYAAFRLDPSESAGRPLTEVLGTPGLSAALAELVERERWEDIPLEVRMNGESRRLSFTGRRIDAGEYRLVLTVAPERV